MLWCSWTALLLPLPPPSCAAPGSGAPNNCAKAALAVPSLADVFSKSSGAAAKPPAPPGPAEGPLFAFADNRLLPVRCGSAVMRLNRFDDVDDAAEEPLVEGELGAELSPRCAEASGTEDAENAAVPEPPAAPPGGAGVAKAFWVCREEPVSVVKGAAVCEFLPKFCLRCGVQTRFSSAASHRKSSSPAANFRRQCCTNRTRLEAP